MALGEQLRNARLKQQRTASQIAAATRMKVQLVEEIEREDFSKIAAPIYGKGFIKLYADEVGLDPAPLVHEYVSRFVHGGSRRTISSPSLSKPQAPSPAPPPKKKSPAPSPVSHPQKEAPALEPAPRPESPPKPLSDIGLDRKPVSAPEPVHVRMQPEPVEVKPQPGSAPAVELEEEEEPDLFEHLVDRKEERDFSQRDKPMMDLEVVRDFFTTLKARIVTEGIEPCVDLCKKLREATATRMRDGLSALRQWKPKMPARPRAEKEPAGSLVKTVSILVGTMIIVILLLSGLSTCGRDPGSTTPPGSDAEIRRPLVTAIDPPAPYLE